MKKALCFQCRKWSNDTTICEHCGSIISQELKDEIKRKEEKRLNPPKPPSGLSRALDYLRNSSNPILKLIYYILMTVWITYVGIVMLIMYIASSVVG